MEIITPCEKIKNLRKRLKITQDKITKSFNKSQISKIENGHADITIDMAKEIVECVNEIAQKKGIKTDITVANLMETKEVQIANILNEYLKKLQNTTDIKKFETELKEVEDFIKQYTIEKEYSLQLDIFSLAVDRFLDNEQYIVCSQYILKCIDIAFILNNHELVAGLVLKLTRVYSFIGCFQHVIICGEYILKTGYGIKETLKKINFNLARAYHNVDNQNNTKNILKSISILTELEKNFDLNYTEKHDLNILLANCYRDSNELTKAAELYIKTIKSTHDRFVKILAYGNLAEVYYMKKKFKNAKISIDLVINFITEKAAYLSREINVNLNAWYDALLIYCALDNDFNKILFCFNKSIKLAEKSEDIYFQIKIYKFFIEYCIKSKQDKYIISTLNIMYDKITILKNREVLDPFIMACSYYKSFDLNTFNNIWFLIEKITLIFEEKKYK